MFKNNVMSLIWKLEAYSSSEEQKSTSEILLSQRDKNPTENGRGGGMCFHINFANNLFMGQVSLFHEKILQAFCPWGILTSLSS